MVNINRIRIGTRGSRLAIAQAMMVKNKLVEVLNYPEHLIDIITIKTSGDKFANADLSKIGGKGLFLKEIEEALIDDQIDIAVHALKDVPGVMPSGLEICAVLERDDPRDILLSNEGLSIMELKPNAVIGTCSPRRKVQLLSLRPDLKCVLFRGNIETRIKKLQCKEVDGTMLALAGIARIGISDIKYQLFDLATMVPAIGQGAIGIEVKSNNREMINILRKINHQKSFIEVNAERSFLKALEGDCNSPIAAYAKIVSEHIKFEYMVATEDYKYIYRECVKLCVNNYIYEASHLGTNLKLDLRSHELLAR